VVIAKIERPSAAIRGVRSSPAVLTPGTGMMLPNGSDVEVRVAW
jgi:hypothetical protein